MAAGMADDQACSTGVYSPGHYLLEDETRESGNQGSGNRGLGRLETCGREDGRVRRPSQIGVFSPCGVKTQGFRGWRKC